MSALQKTVSSASSPFPLSAVPRRHRIDSLLDRGSIDLNSLVQPAVAVDCAGLVVAFNSAMSGILGANICMHNNRLRISNVDARARLEGLIQAMAARACPPDTEPIVLKCDDGSPVIVHVMPIPEGAQALFLGASVVLLFARLGPGPHPAPALLSKIFGLTPAESRLASALTDGGTLLEAAKGLNISWETARTQLKAVFLKTDTHRQSELVALLSRL
jgi:DNA-binding CsgD family transcriptional regulator